MQRVADLEALRTVLDGHRQVAVYLTTPGCGPCGAVRPVVLAVFDDPGWRVVEVLSPDAPDVTGQLLVFAHPTLILFADGREAARMSRVIRRADVEDAKERVERLVGG